jgi:HSP20 family protein
MSLIKYNPFVPAKNFGSFFDDFFNRTIGDFVGFDLAISQPSVNVIETADNFKLEVAAPGLEKGDFEVNVEGDYLSISAKKEHKEEVKEGKYTRREFNFTSFNRSFRLPETVSGEKISANYENGVLNVILPKKAEAKTEPTRVIEIK